MALGNQLLALSQQATQTIVLVAPFIKVSVLKKLLDDIDPAVSIRCITRWYPHEIAMGVSDIEIWHLFNAHPQRELWLRSDLHAKYYRADTKCLIGSANLTAKALGWAMLSNLELLLPYDGQSPQLIAFENQLLTGAVRVNVDIYEQMLAAVQNLPPQPELPPEPPTDIEHSVIPSAVWLPSLRHPADLYKAYMGEWERLGQSARIAAVSDLQALNLPPYLPKEQFNLYVGTMLLQMPIIQTVDAFVVEPRRFGAVKALLNSSPCRHTPNFEAGYAWQTLMRWLLYFLPERYTVSIPRHSEVFSRVHFD